MINFILIIISIFNAEPTVSKTWTYDLKGNVKNVINNIMDETDGQGIPDIVRQANIRIYGEAYLKQRYYKGGVELMAPHNKVFGFHKTIEVWQLADDVIRIKSYVYIDYKRSNCPFRWVNGLKQRIISKTEDEILKKEKSILEKLVKE